ncbi:MAG: VCBS repeat-containing protein, partial [Bacteroidales bacterium]|nr:VCBS repeat-containing protein [Bacteroidales bacterium]
SGFQSGYAQFSAYVLSGGEEPTYTFVNVPAGDYTVGVQAVSYSYVASEFATAEVSAYDALNKVNVDIKAIIKGNNLIVKAADMETVNVYSVDGIQVASGMANTPIQLNGKGLYLVKVGNQVIKITK